MYKTGKVWGVTTPLLVTPFLEVHKVTALEGGFSSKHMHERKWNAFYVLSGQLVIKSYKKDYPLVDETILNEGDFTTVPPGEWHAFEVPLEESECTFLEWYYLGPLDSDIVRETCGGTGNQDALTDMVGDNVWDTNGGGGGTGC